MGTLAPRPPIFIDGDFSDWIPSERIDYGDVPGFALYAQPQDGYFNFALIGTAEIGPTTTFWFNTDQTTATGYQVFGFAGGAEFNVEIRSDGTAALYTGGAGETLVLDHIPLAYSADYTAVEFSVPKSVLGDPTAIDVLYDVDNSLYGPFDYSGQPYIAYSDNIERTDFTHRIGILYSQTTADNYFSLTTYAQLFMVMQSQAMQAGISFDILTEADLTNTAKLANYDALVFPSLANVQASQVDAITNSLLQVTRQFGVGLITAGNFLTSDEYGNPLPGDSYARMKLLFDATRVTGGFPADVTLTATEAAPSVFSTLTPGEAIHSYAQVPWEVFQSVSGNGQTLATQTIDGQSYAAALATQTGGMNVLFSTTGIMADNNLLWQAVNYVAKDPGVQISLDLTRSKGIVVSRNDMDQSQYAYNVTPPDGTPGIYDLLLPILQQWKTDYNFVGSYYINIGNNPDQEEMTNWAASAPYYTQILALGNEIGTHSYTHPDDTNLLTPTQIKFEFEQSKLVIEQQMSALLGMPFTISGAAVPGATEMLPTSREIIQYFDYMTGGYSSIGSGYPGAFGFLAPDLTNSVYLAPNTSFDFTLVEFQNLGANGAATAWNAEWNQLVSNAQTPIVLWPWHDYAATMFTDQPEEISPYTLDLFTAWIERAYNSGAEFVTGADLASRIQSFYHSGVTSTINGDMINVNVVSPNASDFALNLSGLDSQVIKSVANWYAYDQDSLFLPQAGGSFTITIGGVADNVTHISALPMRAELLSVTGDGLNLDFSLFGAGTVTIDLGEFGSKLPVVTGGTMVSLTGDMLNISLSAIGLHTVGVTFMAPAPATMVSQVSFSADTGASASDFITNTAAQTISGTLSAALVAGEVMRVSLDGGLTWLAANAAVGATSFDVAATLQSGAGTLVARVENSGGTPGAALMQAYVLDQQAPAAPAVLALSAESDSGVLNSDSITNVTMPAMLGTGAEAGSIVTLHEGTTVLGTEVAAAGGSWSITAGTALANGVHSLSAVATDLAGNASAASLALSITIDTMAPSAPTAPDLLATSDSGASSTDNITNVGTPSFSGNAEGGSTMTLFAGATAIGSGTATINGTWKVAATLTQDGVHSITARAVDVAGNIGAPSTALAVALDKLAPAPPRVVSASSTSTKVTRLDGLGEGGAIVTVLDGTTSVGSATVGSNGKWNMNFQVGKAPRVLTAYQMDRAGNPGDKMPGAAVIGTGGNDTLIGGASNDFFFGGAGTDTFRFDPGFGNDLISDFLPTGSARDIINFRAIPNLASFSDVLAHAGTVGGEVVIALDSTNSLTLAGVKLGSLTASNFTFV